MHLLLNKFCLGDKVKVKGCKVVNYELTIGLCNSVFPVNYIMKEFAVQSFTLSLLQLIVNQNSH